MNTKQEPRKPFKISGLYAATETTKDLDSGISANPIDTRTLRFLRRRFPDSGGKGSVSLGH